LLTKLESDRKHGTDYFGHKFMAKVQEIFNGLPKPKDVRSFEGNDLPLLFTANEVQQFALEHKLNKSQTKAVDALQKAAPDVFKEIAEEKRTEQARLKAEQAEADRVRLKEEKETIERGIQNEKVNLFISTQFFFCFFFTILRGNIQT
jgi:hypothetical protein